MSPGSCPSDLVLEQHLLDAAPDGAAQHVSACPACQSRLAAMNEEQQLFRTTVRPATLDSILARSGRATHRWWRWVTPVLAVPAFAAVVFFVGPRETIQLKGTATAHAGEAPPAPLVLTVFAGSGGVVHAVADGDEIPAAAALRFSVAADNPCWLSIASIDDQGTVSHLYPDGAPAQSIKPGSALPGGALLDGHPGSERLFAVCAPQPVSEDALTRAVRGAVSHIPPILHELPAGSLQATILVRKSP